MRIVKILLLPVVLFALLVPSTWASYGQETSQPPTLKKAGQTITAIERPPTTSPNLSATPTITPRNSAVNITATQAITQAYLALVYNQEPTVRIQFAASRDSNNHPIDPNTTFAYGITTLYYFVTLIDAEHIQYCEQWIINGVYVPLLDYCGASPYYQTYYTDGIRYISNVPLERGSYQLTILLNGVPYKQMSASIL